MLETKIAFEHLGLSTDCATRVVQEVSEKLTEATNPIAAAKKLMHALVGVDVEFQDARQARMVVARTAEMLVRMNHKIDDVGAVIASAQAHVEKFLNNKNHAWMWAEDESAATADVSARAVVEGIEMKVAVKADGTIKKGGKQVLAAEMYKKNVLEAAVPMTNQQFVALLMKELNMGKAGATTYAYNVKKELGEPAGGIVKSKKGRKAAE